MLRWILPLLALTFALAPEAQPMLHGRLLTPDGTPRADTRIRIFSGAVARGVLDSTRTDADGRFVLTLPGEHLYGLDMGSPMWVPLAAQEASGAEWIDLEIRLGHPADADGFAATSSVPVIAEVMEVYAEAERYHWTPVETPEMLVMQAVMETRVSEAPMSQKESVRDSLLSLFQEARRAVTAERVRVFLAGRTPEAHPLVQEAYALTAFDRVHKDSAQAALFIERVPASSPLWSFQGLSGPGVGNIIGYAAMHLGEPMAMTAPSESFMSYTRYLATEYPDPNVRQRALQRLFDFSRASGDEEEARATYDLLARDFPDSREVEVIRRAWDDTRAVRPGETLPSFSFAALPDTTQTVASGDVEGKTYLLDFWGSWCFPCIREMPKLHALYERYRARGFEIVSVAVMDTPETIEAFKAKGFPMPWLHGLIADGDREGQREAEARFEFNGYPSAILVGPDGVILAEGSGARGKQLEQALAKQFGD